MAASCTEQDLLAPSSAAHVRVEYKTALRAPLRAALLCAAVEHLLFMRQQMPAPFQALRAQQLQRVRDERAADAAACAAKQLEHEKRFGGGGGSGAGARGAGGASGGGGGGGGGAAPLAAPVAARTPRMRRRAGAG